MKLLLIEDEAMVGTALSRGLEEAGYDCTWTQFGEQGLEAAKTGTFDVLILDLLLPDISGFDVLQSLREAGVTTPVLVLTALGSVQNRVRGLKGGADDYLVKPFAFAELTARLTALTRRSVSRPSPVLGLGPLSLDVETRTVTCAESPVDLSPTEFSVLEMLMRHAGQVVTRQMLAETIWNNAEGSSVTNVIDVHISRLRSKIGRHFEGELIHTIRGRGYALRVPAEEADPPTMGSLQE